MRQCIRLQEECRTRRRTIADAVDVVRQKLGLNEVARATIRIGPLQLPSGDSTALVDVVFPDLGYVVSLPTSAQFKALHGTGPLHKEFEISLLDRAEVYADGSVLLLDGTRLRAVEVRPTYLPYEPSELDYRILRHAIFLTNSAHCYRKLLEGLPPEFKDKFEPHFQDVRALEYSRVRTIRAPLLKVLRGYIEDTDPELKVSNQKIADALATFGVRIPRRRRRAA